jgi:hypothetical protein
VLLSGVKPEFKVSALFGVLALVFSLMTSLFAGNRFSHVVAISCVLAAVFAALGYGIMYVLKRYVPEIYEALAGINGFSLARQEAPEEMVKVNIAPQAGTETPREEAGSVPADAGAEDPREDGVPGPPAAEAPKADTSAAFVPLREADFSRVSAQAQEGKLGKHIIEEKKIRYEPKIMAEAIRTMIGRDKD